jgi:phage terminase large subunit-like protein
MATLPSPSDTSQDLILTEDQMDFLVDFYAIDSAGALVYRRGAWEGSKGIGKSPFGAMVCLAEFAGPTAPETPLVQVAALSEDQADSTVYSLVFELVRANDRRVAQRLGIDDGRGRLFLNGRPGKLEAITAKAGSHEGERTTFALLDQTDLWTRANGGQALARTIRRNVGKTGGRSLELANAPEPGLGSVAEVTEADYRAGRPGILFVARRPLTIPDASMTDAELAAIIASVYGTAPWVDQARILAEIRDPATPWNEAARFFLNAPAAAADVLVDPPAWAALGTAGPIPDGARVGVGFDGSMNHDGTALVVCDLEGHTELALLIERDPNDPPEWTVPRALVNDTVAALFARFDVGRMECDPYKWRDEIEEWGRLYGEAVVLSQPTNSIRRFGPAVDRFRAAIAAGRVSHRGDRDLARHMGNARLVRGPGRGAEGHQLYTLEKAGPGRLIDAAVAATLAYEAAATLREAPQPEKDWRPMVHWGGSLLGPSPGGET